MKGKRNPDYRSLTDIRWARVGGKTEPKNVSQAYMDGQAGTCTTYATICLWRFVRDQRHPVNEVREALEHRAFLHCSEQPRGVDRTACHCETRYEQSPHAKPLTKQLWPTRHAPAGRQRILTIVLLVTEEMSTRTRVSRDLGLPSRGNDSIARRFGEQSLREPMMTKHPIHQSAQVPYTPESEFCTSLNLHHLHPPSGVCA